MTELLATVELGTRKPGILLYSPFAAQNIREGENYFDAHYSEPQEVATHIRAGTLVAFQTEEPGTFILKFFRGDPTKAQLRAYEFQIALGIEVRDRTLCARDVDDLCDWKPECPESQKVVVEDGFYHLLLLSRTPPSGELGDDQEVLIFMERRAAMPPISWQGVPSLTRPLQ